MYVWEYVLDIVYRDFVVWCMRMGEEEGRGAASVVMRCVVVVQFCSKSWCVVMWYACLIYEDGSFIYLCVMFMVR